VSVRVPGAFTLPGADRKLPPLATETFTVTPPVKVTFEVVFCPAVSVTLTGFGVAVSTIPETLRVTLMVSPVQLLPWSHVRVIVPVYAFSLACRPAGFALTVSVAGVVAWFGVTESQFPGELAATALNFSALVPSLAEMSVVVVQLPPHCANV
jgi:hypothetical protein